MPREVFNARTLIVASSIAAIPIIAGSLYVTIYQKRRRRRTKALSIDSGGEPKQRKTEKIIPMQSLETIEQQQQPLQKVEKSQIRTAGTAAAVASSIEASKERSTTITTTTTTSTAVPMQEQQRISSEAPVSTKARQAGESLKELFVTAAREAKGSAKKTGRRLKEQTVDIAATADSKDIRSLGSDVENMTGLFEDMMAEIRKEGYDEQVTLLDSYKRLLQKQIRVLDAGRKLASKLKPGT
jgi:membrane protein YdbS with pleckstrin-like domain